MITYCNCKTDHDITSVKIDIAWKEMENKVRFPNFFVKLAISPGHWLTPVRLNPQELIILSDHVGVQILKCRRHPIDPIFKYLRCTI